MTNLSTEEEFTREGFITKKYAFYETNNQHCVHTSQREL